jgi:hypothetical protein
VSSRDTMMWPQRDMGSEGPTSACKKSATVIH